MAKPMIVKTDGYNAFTRKCDSSFAIRLGGKRGKFWAPEGTTPGAYATFQTRARAEHFIADGGLIVVEVLKLADVMAACGWNEDEGFSEDNSSRFRAWLEANGVHYYGRPREEFFPSAGIREAQKLGLSKIVMEDLS
jgi:hypothetical protein